MRSQAIGEAEYIVVDGGSTDGTVSLIEANGDIVNRFVSEPDRGIYDAMNKGIRLSTAPYLLFLNAGDTLYDADTLSRMTEALEERDADLLYGDVLLEKDGTEWIKRQPRRLSLRYLFVNNLCHQSIVFKRSLFERFGSFDAGEALLADFKFLFALKLSGEVSMRHAARIVCRYPLTGVSSRTSFAYNYRHRSRVIKSLTGGRLYWLYQVCWFAFKPLTVLRDRWARWTSPRLS